jgi:TonB-dependent receptor
MNNKLILLFSFILSAFSLANTGTIKGIITDSLTNEPLVGANIIIEGTSRGSATNLGGEYLIPSVSAGDYIVIVSYISYQTKRITVKVRADEVTELNIKLNFDVVEGEVVIVTGQLQGQAEAINRQLTSNTIVNVVSSDKIQELPDQNAAESVGRLPGISIQRDGGEGQKVVIRGLSPRFSSITINGMNIPSTDPEDRSVDLSMISPDVLAGIEVYKSLTPDRDADAIGGEVNFITNYAEEGFKGDARLQTGYNGHDREYGQYRSSIKISNRYFNNNLGVIFTGGLQRANRGSDILDAGYIVGSEDVQRVGRILLTDLTLGDRLEVRERYNAGVSLDYKLDNGGLFFNSLWGKTDRNELVRQREYDIEQNVQLRNMKDSELHTELLSSSLSGEHLLPAFFNLDANWMVSYSKTNQEIPFSHSVIFREVSAFAANVVLNSGPERIPEFAHNRLHQTFFKSSQLRQESTDDSDLAAKLDLKMPFSFTDNLLGYMKFGGKYRGKSRDRNVYLLKSSSFGIEQDLPNKYPDRWDLDGVGRIKFSNFLNPGFEVNDFLNGSYIFGSALDANKLNNFLEQYRYEYLGTEQNPVPLYTVDPEALVKSYTAAEQVVAGYIMSEINIGPSLMLLPGIRYEKTINDYSTVFGKPIQSEDEAEILLSGRIDTIGQSSYEEWMPMVHFRFKATSWFDIRMAVTRSLSRPNYYNLVPHRNFTDLGGTLVLGNPKLKPITSWNYDVFLSFYSQLGLFTFGLFKKDVHDVDYVRTRRVREDEDFGLVSKIIQPENITSISDVYGFEIELQTNLRSFPSPFDGIILYANYSFISSKTFYPFLSVKTGGPPFFLPTLTDTIRQAPMIGQADQIANFSIGYEKGGFTGRLSMIYQGAILRHVNLREELDQYDDAFIRWDVAIQQQIFEGISLFLNLNNISDRPESTFLWKEIYPTGQEFFGWTGDLGIRLKL